MPAAAYHAGPPDTERARVQDAFAAGSGHREAGLAVLDVFSEWKSIYVDFSGRLQRPQIDTQDL